MTTTISAQKIVDTPPITLTVSSGTAFAGLNTSLIVYSGLVPMSP